jgi:hypothetical protein
MRQQWVGTRVVAVWCAVLGMVSAARAQRLEAAVEAGFAEDFGPLPTGFGMSVALSGAGDRALVGVPGGAVIVFLRTGGAWAEEARLEAGEDESDVVFGAAVALSAAGDVALIGAPSATGGTARVFVREGASWSEQAVLSAVAGQPADSFGVSVALSADGHVALVGAPAAQTASGDAAGRAHAFAEAGGTWTEQAVLEAEGAHAGEDFGRSVALSADGAVAVIGAPQTETEAGQVGSARVFVALRWRSPQTARRRSSVSLRIKTTTRTRRRPAARACSSWQLKLGPSRPLWAAAPSTSACSARPLRCLPMASERS